MPLAIYNSLTRRKEPFEAREPGVVRMYVCRPNLYGPAHVGHALSYTFFDVVRRYLEHKGFAVRHVQNFTDIEDRIVERAQQDGRSIFEISQEYIDRFLREMDSLNIQRAQPYPRAARGARGGRAPAWRWTSARSTRWTSRSGRRPSPVNRRGTARGDRAGRGGISSARQCRCRCWASRSTSTAGATTCASRTTRTRSRSPKRIAESIPLSASGFTTR